MHLPGNMISVWHTPFEEYPEKIQDILINGTNGHSVKVYYKGQRGEGVYDVAFAGTDPKCGAADTGRQVQIP